MAAGQARQQRGRQQVQPAQDQGVQNQAMPPAVPPAPAHQQPVRMYAATVAEALEDTTVVTGTLPVGFVPARVLFDSGCTHSFISYTHASRIGCEIEELGHSLLVSTPAGSVIATGECVRNVPVEIQQRQLVADLILFKLQEFDVIFGIN